MLLGTRDEPSHATALMMGSIQKEIKTMAVTMLPLGGQTLAGCGM